MEILPYKLRKMVNLNSTSGQTNFYYKKNQLREWKGRGEKHGDAGFILVSRRGHTLTYYGYGTPEYPCTEYKKIIVYFNPDIHGEMPTDEDRLIGQFNQELAVQKYYKKILTKEKA